MLRTASTFSVKVMNKCETSQLKPRIDDIAPTNDKLTHNVSESLPNRTGANDDDQSCNTSSRCNGSVAPANHWSRTLHYLCSSSRAPKLRLRRMKALSTALLTRKTGLTQRIPKNVFYFNRNAVANAVLIGLFIAMLPIPMQMIVAAIAAVVANTVCIAATWSLRPSHHSPPTTPHNPVVPL